MTERLSRRALLGWGAGITAGLGVLGCGARPGAEGDARAEGTDAAGAGGAQDAARAGGAEDAAQGEGGAAPGSPDVTVNAGVKAGGVMVKIELTHDVICPWCRIGHGRLKKALAQWQGPVEVVYRPFLLDPDVPPEGVDLRQRLAERYGATRLDGMFERVTQIGRADGLHFDFEKVRRTPNTVLAHLLVDLAPADKKQALLDAMHTGYFEQGADIGNAAVLRELGLGVGLDAAALDAALADTAGQKRIQQAALAASRAGIRGVPHFRVGAVTLEGAQPVDSILEALRRSG